MYSGAELEMIRGRCLDRLGGAVQVWCGLQAYELDVS
jgi:hypothetical protein